ncbi:MAG: prepilin-type N-terminal cleavage/methylation domain-containing protein [Candidatus Pacebacteria bacterium]|nr:prepilin-type N-terminal cleavage/methylation domain-containing protein [Candidatus Paceibacterota bacterium]
MTRNTQSQINESPGQRCFTLVELLVAMAVLVILMSVLFQFTGAARRAWLGTSSNTRIYENSRIAMELLARDIKNAVASDTLGEEIPFYIYNHDPVSMPEIITIVSPTDIDTTSQESRLCEVTYAHSTNGTNEYTLQRQAIGDNNAQWDFFGNTGSGWQNTPATRDYQEVIRGVDDVTITCHQADGSAFATGALPYEANQLPAFVEISLTLFDENLMRLKDTLSLGVWQEQKRKTLRTFTRIVFLP